MQSEDLINQVLEEIESFNIDDIPNIDSSGRHSRHRIIYGSGNNIS